MGQRVVCAANKLTNGHILLGIRHWDMFMHRSFDEYVSYMGKEDDLETFEIEMIYGEEQGFVDQFGKFLTRKEARVIAEKNGQIIRECGPTDELYSENIY